MAKHKVSELQGALLDAAVAKAYGVDMTGMASLLDDPGSYSFSPSKRWKDAGPIIERERIAPQPERRGDIGNEWADRPEPALGWEVRVGGRTITGPTYLIAAMRAYVASAYGEEVDLP